MYYEHFDWRRSEGESQQIIYIVFSLYVQCTVIYSQQIIVSGSKYCRIISFWLNGYYNDGSARKCVCYHVLPV